MPDHAPSTVSLPLMAIAAVATALFWGVYGPLLTWGHTAMIDSHGESYGRLRPFICVGIAYLIVAIVGPILLISFGIMEPGKGIFTGWSMGGIGWSLIAGGAGAMGALFLLIALNYAPTKPYPPPLYVMPLVFGIAPVINTMFTMWHRWLKTGTPPSINPFFAAGMILVAVGAITVLISSNLKAAPAKPKESTPAETKPAEAESTPEKPTEEK